MHLLVVVVLIPWSSSAFDTPSRSRSIAWHRCCMPLNDTKFHRYIRVYQAHRFSFPIRKVEWRGLSVTASIPIAGSQLAVPRHVCAFFNSADEEYRVLLPC